MAVIGYPKGAIVRLLTPEGVPVDVSIGDPGSMSIGHAVVDAGGFRIGDLVQLNQGFRVIPYGPRSPERGYWLLSEATSTSYDHDRLCYVYSFPDGVEESVAREVVGNLEADVRVPKAATGTANAELSSAMVNMGTISPAMIGTTSTFHGTGFFRDGTVDKKLKARPDLSPRAWLDHRVSEIAEQGRL